MNENNEDKLLSIAAACDDLDRWVLLSAMKGRISYDRRDMIASRAKQIVDWADALEAE